MAAIADDVAWLSVVAALAAVAVSISLCRHIRSLAWLAVVLCAGTLLTTLIVIVAGLLNFDASLITFPPDAFRLDRRFRGLGRRDADRHLRLLGLLQRLPHGRRSRSSPRKTIPRAVMLSVLIVAAIYMTMNIAIMGVVPWQQVMESKNIAADFMEILYGRNVAVGFSFFIIWAALASVFVMTLGYSRILYAAARNGDFFQHLRLLASARPVSDRGTAVAGRADGRVLFLFAGDGDRRGRDGADRRAVPGADLWACTCCAPRGPTWRCRFACGSIPLPSLIAAVGLAVHAGRAVRSTLPPRWP